MTEGRAIDEPTARDLRDDPAVRRLVRFLALAEAFRFYLLVVPTPGLGRAVFAVLAEEVAAERNEPVKLVCLDPYQAQAEPDAPIPSNLLVDEVLAPLVEPSADTASPHAVVVVDATRAPPRDLVAWKLLFHRMNERRNVVAGALAGALVLALPPWLEAVFAWAAPDFWSIRSLAACVQVSLRETRISPRRHEA